MKKTIFGLIILSAITVLYLYLKIEHYKLECHYKFGDESISYVTKDGSNSCTTKNGIMRMP